MQNNDSDLGATVRSDGSTHFLLWAPKSSSVDLHLVAPNDYTIPMESVERGYWAVSVDEAPAGTRYFFRHDGSHEWPDPASRSQPDGVHGASEVIDPSTFEWSADLWRAPALDDYVIYELHIGTFTQAGTFDAAIEQLDRLVELGITAIEIMPVAEFPGGRNWGYDGAYRFAAESTYGGPWALARLVDACHMRGLAVILDVIYNHFGPEGAYQGLVGNYFTDTYRTPWGSAINFDGPYSDEVRRFYIESAQYWLRSLRIDAFRLDAVHAMFDQSARPFLRQFTSEIHRTAQALGRTAYLIAESDLNDPLMIQPPELGGFGLDAQWSDDLHHAIHARLTGESEGYYGDFGFVAHIKRALSSGYVYTGQYSEYRGRSHGAVPHLLSPNRFVVCLQNHDQVGNRAVGDRLSSHLNFEQLKLSATTILLSPFIPLLFMGEEYGETAPFQYFTSHSDPAVIDGVRRGRAEEFKSFRWSGEVPDPQDKATFQRSKLRLEQRSSPTGTWLEAYYRSLIRLRKEHPGFDDAQFDRQEVDLGGKEDSVIVMRRWNGRDVLLILLNYHDQTQTIRIPGLDEVWRLVLNSAEEKWGGPLRNCHNQDLIRSGDDVVIRASSAIVLENARAEKRS